MKNDKDLMPIDVDSAVRKKTRDAAQPAVSRVEQLPVDAATQPYANVIAQVREMVREAKKRRR